MYSVLYMWSDNPEAVYTKLYTNLLSHYAVHRYDNENILFDRWLFRLKYLATIKQKGQ